MFMLHLAVQQDVGCRLDRSTPFPYEYFYENAIYRVGRADSSRRSSSTVQSRCYCSRAARWRRGEAEREEGKKDGIEEVICICICMYTRRKVGLSLDPFLRTSIARVLISIGCQSFPIYLPRLSEKVTSLATAY